jgi:hypothetical protein
MRLSFPSAYDACFRPRRELASPLPRLVFHHQSLHASQCLSASCYTPRSAPASLCVPTHRPYSACGCPVRSQRLSKKRKAQQKQTERKKTKERKTKDKKRTRDDPFGNFCSQLFRARIMPFSSFAFIFPFSVLIRTCDQQRL